MQCMKAFRHHVCKYAWAPFRNFGKSKLCLKFHKNAPDADITHNAKYSFSSVEACCTDKGAHELYSIRISPFIS